MDDLDIIDAEIVEDMTVEEVTPRQVQAADLRRLADLLEANPEIPLPRGFGANQYNRICWYATSVAEAAAVVKMFGGRWEKNDPNAGDWDADNLRMHRKLDELEVEVVVSRERVCEKTVVGTKRVKKRVVVQAPVYEERYVDEDEVEFECKSLLSVAERDRLAALEAAS